MNFRNPQSLLVFSPLYLASSAWGTTRNFRLKKMDGASQGAPKKKKIESDVYLADGH
jgi:hypothetical protein